MTNVAAIHREALATEITPFSRCTHGRNLGDAQVSAEAQFAKWQTRLVDLAPDQWKLISELEDEMPGLSPGMSQYETFGNFIKRELFALARELRGLPATNLRFEAYQAIAARDARAFRDANQPQLGQLAPVKRDRDAAYDRRRYDTDRLDRLDREDTRERYVDRRPQPQP